MYDDERVEWVRRVRYARTSGDAPEPTLLASGRTDPARELRRADRAGVRPRRAPGPRPVRPAATPVSVRPAQGDRPPARPESVLRACPHRERTLPRRAPMVPRSTAGPGQRMLAGALVVLLAAAVVVGLGQLLALGGGADPAPAVVAPVAALVTVGDEETVWDLARRLEPAADGPRQAALAEWIAKANTLTSVELRPGQVLRVPSG